MITYDRLWKTMQSKGITKYCLIKYHGVSSGQLNRIKNNHHVSTHTLEVLCNVLECRIEDIVEIVTE